MNQSEQVIPTSTDIGDISIPPPSGAIGRRNVLRLWLCALL